MIVIVIAVIALGNTRLTRLANGAQPPLCRIWALLLTCHMSHKILYTRTLSSVTDSSVVTRLVTRQLVTSIVMVIPPCIARQRAVRSRTRAGPEEPLSCKLYLYIIARHRAIRIRCSVENYEFVPWSGSYGDRSAPAWTLELYRGRSRVRGHVFY